MKTLRTNESPNFEILPFDIQSEIIQKKVYENPDLKLVSKSWNGIVAYILNNKKNEIIKELFSKNLPILKDENCLKLIMKYKNKTCTSAVEFIHCWLNLIPKSHQEVETQIKFLKKKKQTQIDEIRKLTSELATMKFDHKNNQICALKDVTFTNAVNSKGEPISKSVQFLNKLLTDREIEMAFAYAAFSDKCEKSKKCSWAVQEFIRNSKDGFGLDFEKTYKLIESLNTIHTRGPALTVFFDRACKEFVVTTTPLIQNYKLLEDPLICLLNKYKIKNMPNKVVLLFIKKIELLLAQKHGSEKSDNIRNEIVRILLKNIPNRFSFISEKGLTIFNHYQLEIFPKIPRVDKLMDQNKVQEFIDTINSIPHKGLKYELFGNIMELFYSQKPDMHEWIEILTEIERATKQPNYAIEELIKQCIESGINTFINTFEKTKNFLRLKNVLNRNPEWFRDFESKNSSKTKKMYSAVCELLLDKNELKLLALVINKIKDIKIRNEFKKLYVDCQ